MRHLVREITWNLLNQHRPSGVPNIALFGSRRSGTTIMAEVISANPGLKLIDQPLSLFTASPYQLRRMPVFTGGPPFALTEKEKQRLILYFSDILEGRIHINEPWRLWRSGFSYRSNRIILKLTNAHGIAEWLAKQFMLQTIVAVRHPIAQSLSLMRNQWELKMPGFLHNERYCETYLRKNQVDFSHDILRNGSELHKYVLDWCLENLPLIRAFPHHPEWYFVSYEDFVLNAPTIIAEWADVFGLPATKAMAGVAKRPSLSANRASEVDIKTAIAYSDHMALLTRWRAKVDEDTERSVMKILEVLEIDLYRAGSSVAELGHRAANLSGENLRVAGYDAYSSNLNLKQTYSQDG